MQDIMDEIYAACVGALVALIFSALGGAFNIGIAIPISQGCAFLFCMKKIREHIIEGYDTDEFTDGYYE